MKYPFSISPFVCFSFSYCQFVRSFSSEMGPKFKFFWMQLLFFEVSFLMVFFFVKNLVSAFGWLKPS